MITVFTCDNDYTSILSCIYDAFMSRLGHSNIRLEIEPIEQYSLFENYVHVDADDRKASEVFNSINSKISPYFYGEIAYCFGAFEKDTLNTIYRMLVLGFKYGPSALDMYQYKDVVRFKEISRRYGNEAHSFREFARFTRYGDIYIAHIEPKSHVLLPVAEYFIDRMPSEHWIIVDDVHKEAIIHPVNSPYYLRKLTPEEFAKLSSTDENADSFAVWWKAYFKHIAIKERENYTCQLNHFPKWKRTHVTEFM